jgi:hypothetical protein
VAAAAAGGGGAAAAAVVCCSWDCCSIVTKSSQHHRSNTRFPNVPQTEAARRALIGEPRAVRVEGGVESEVRRGQRVRLRSFGQ